MATAMFAKTLDNSKSDTVYICKPKFYTELCPWKPENKNSLHQLVKKDVPQACFLWDKNNFSITHIYLWTYV
jgi:hypothetical protein